MKVLEHVTKQIDCMTTKPYGPLELFKSLRLSKLSANGHSFGVGGRGEVSQSSYMSVLLRPISYTSCAFIEPETNT